MIKRTIEISQQPVHVTVRNRQVLLLRKPDKSPALNDPHADSLTFGGPNADDPAAWRRRGQSDDILASIPCEDIGLLLVEHPGVSYSHSALATLLEFDAGVVICGRDHLPAGLLLPLSQHTEVVWRITDQVALARPARKQLWRQVVQAKIRAQAANLTPGSPTRSRLLALARQVRSGDPTNVEAQAARAYWPALFSGMELPLSTAKPAALAAPFRRDPDALGVNALLNYGYTVLRAAVARAIVGAGLLPVLGIHHSNRSNAFCLADDLVEPLRPLVDACVRGIVAHGEDTLTPQTKRTLLELLTTEVRCGELEGPLMVALHRYIASFVRCLDGAEKRLEIPAATCSVSLGGRSAGT